MAPVMEKMHQRTGKDEQKGQDAENVRGMLSQQIKARDQQKSAEHDAGARAP